MDEKLKIFWNLDVLVKMCRSKSDGPSLRIEEEEILEKINASEQEIEEIKAALEEDTYDTSAEMADRNIEIITKKQLQSLKSELKEKNKELNRLKDQENALYNSTSLLRENKASNEKYIASMQERLSENTDREVLDRYNALITETLTKINELTEELKEENTSYEDIQNQILATVKEIEEIEATIDKKKKLLAETQVNLENKENYIDQTKKEKNTKKINDITAKIESLQTRLEEIRKDPKYIETKIKDIINSKEDKQNARDYLSELVKIVIDQPYINVPVDNSLEEELLRATQARDSFANEIDEKSYNILEANTPEKIRTDFLTKRIEVWKEDLKDLQVKINEVDKDSQFNYEKNDRELQEMIKGLKNDLKEFERAYNETADANIGVKASLEVALEEKREDIVEAEKIANAFKTNEAEDIANATRAIKYQCEQLNNNIQEAEDEIKRIRNRLMSKKSGLIDIASRNKDKDVLKDLAQTVIDLKHRRQFPETPLEIVQRLEEELDIKILDEEDMTKIQNSCVIERKNYDEYIKEQYEIPEKIEEVPEEPTYQQEEKEVGNVEIMNPEDLFNNDVDDEELKRLAAQAVNDDENFYETTEEDEESTEDSEGGMSYEEPVEEAPVEEEEIPVEEEIVTEPTEEVVEEVEENEPEKEIPDEEVEEVTEAPVEEVYEEEAPVEETTEEVQEEQPIPEEVEPTELQAPEAEETPEEEAPVVDETPAPMPEEPVEEVQEEVTEEPVVEQPIEEQPVQEETPATPVAEEDIEMSLEDAPVAEPIATSEVTPQVNAEASLDDFFAAPTVDEAPTEAPQDNPFGDAINPLANEEPAQPEEPQEEVVELSSSLDPDLSIDSMFSNSIELSEGQDKEQVRNNLSNELDNYINNLDEK